MALANERLQEIGHIHDLRCWHLRLHVQYHAPCGQCAEQNRRGQDLRLVPRVFMDVCRGHLRDHSQLYAGFTNLLQTLLQASMCPNLEPNHQLFVPISEESDRSNQLAHQLVRTSKETIERRP